MATRTSRAEPRPLNVEELTVAEGRALFDAEVKKHLGISGEEFIQKWDSGAFDDPDDPLILRLSLLIPFARRSTHRE